MQTLPVPMNNSRVGFHYYPDADHYREADLQKWLPVLKSLNASWLVLQAPVDRAIPEDFIKLLVSNNIEPVIQFQLNPANPPLASDLDVLFSAYKSWGAHYLVLFDRPNMRKSWSSATWTQQDLVERFLDRFIPFASLTISKGLIPVFPPLEPGGDYWDTTFLKAAFDSMIRRGQQQILDNLVLSAYAHLNENGLNWGAGGPERWAGAKPYHNSPDNEDQRGFHIFDWYEAIAKTTLQKEVPILLLGVSPKIPSTQSKDFSRALDATWQAQNYLSIYQLLNREKVNSPGAVEKTLDPMPDPVIGCNFYSLCADAQTKDIALAWYKSEAEPAPFVEAIKTWLGKRKVTTKTVLEEQDPATHPISHYLLLPSYEWGISDWHLEAARPFIKKHSPTIGFSLAEAALAAKVTVVGGPQTFSDEDLVDLEKKGCQVERISGDGTSIASLLAER